MVSMTIENAGWPPNTGRMMMPLMNSWTGYKWHAPSEGRADVFTCNLR
jgi:hypothetical protein